MGSIPASCLHTPPDEGPRRRATVAIGVLIGIFSAAGPLWAQGEDSTPTERNALVIAELLERVYDNYNQVYFDRRIGYPENERHDRIELRVNRDWRAGLHAHGLSGVSGR